MIQSCAQVPGNVPERREVSAARRKQSPRSQSIRVIKKSMTNPPSTDVPNILFKLLKFGQLFGR